MTATGQPFTERRAMMRWVYAAAGVIGASVIAAAAVLVAPHHRGPPDPTRIIAFTAVTALAMAWSVGFATLAFRRLDEFQRAASKFAWYWGGSIGLATSAPAYSFVMLGGLHWLDPGDFHLGAGLARAFALGYGLAVVSILLGFLAALAFWRFTRR